MGCVSSRFFGPSPPTRNRARHEQRVQAPNLRAHGLAGSTTAPSYSSLGAKAKAVLDQYGKPRGLVEQLRSEEVTIQKRTQRPGPRPSWPEETIRAGYAKTSEAVIKWVPTGLPYILNLPLEIILQIASYLPWWQLYSLRLTSKHFCAIISPISCSCYADYHICQRDFTPYTEISDMNESKWAKDNDVEYCAYHQEWEWRMGYHCMVD